MEPLTSKKFAPDVKKRRENGEAGFTLIESIVAVAILTIGLIGTAAAITTAWRYQQISRNVTEAKSILLAQIEEIHSLRDSRRLRFRQIDNVSTLPTNIIGARVAFTGFLDGFQEIYNQPGPDGVFGTADDTGTTRPGFKRQIQIVDPAGDTNIKVITVTVQYPGPDGQVFTLNCVSFLNNDYKQ